MPIHETDPWRRQYFNDVACPHEVHVPTDDPLASELHPQHRAACCIPSNCTRLSAGLALRARMAAEFGLGSTGDGLRRRVHAF